MEKKISKKNIISFLELNLGVFLAACSTAIFLRPYNIIGGGAGGLGILIESIFKIDAVLVMYLVNLVLVTLGFFLMGKDFFFKTVYGSLAFPSYVALISYIYNFFNIEEIDLFLVIIFGAILTGIGIGLTLKNNGTTGGTDIIQAILFKYFNIPYSKTMYIVDGFIIFMGLIFVSFTNGLAAIVYVALNGFVIDLVAFGGFNKRAVFIISEKADLIKEYIINEIVRGTTNVITEGGYDHQKRNMIIVVLETNEYFSLRAKIEEIDKYAFIFVTKATEVRGLGFSLESPARLKRKKK